MGGGCIKIAGYMINALSAVIALEYISHGFEKKYKDFRGIVLFLGGCAVYFMTVTLLNHFTHFEGFLGISYGIILYLYCLVALEGKKVDFFLLSLIWVLIAVISAYVMFAVLGMITNNELGVLLQAEGAWRSYSALAAGALKFSLGRISQAIYKRKQQAIFLLEDWMMAGIFLVIFFLTLSMFHLEEGMLSQKERYYLSLWILGGIFSLVMLLGGFYRLLGNYRMEKLKLEYQKERRELQEEQIHDLYRIGRNANRMRHDMHIQLDVVYRLMKKGDYHAAEKNMQKLGAEWLNYPEIPKDTGNEGLNAALLKAAQDCQEKNIKFHYVVLGRTKEMDSLDMGNLINNLLSNGIEACLECEQEKELEIVIRREKENLEIEVENTIKESVLEKNPCLIPHKKEKENHGFGMVSIREIVERYHGEYICHEESSRFVQTLLLKII